MYKGRNAIAEEPVMIWVSIHLLMLKLQHTRECNIFSCKVTICINSKIQWRNCNAFQYPSYVCGNRREMAQNSLTGNRGSSTRTKLMKLKTMATSHSSYCAAWPLLLFSSSSSTHFMRICALNKLCIIPMTRGPNKKRSTSQTGRKWQSSRE